ncbi:hypothetical protein PHLGIDRAFT_31657 [Phlebiopsis gigantea 11061_1 CR5-6]|uniref:mRNA stability protein n=1 Tax=Phlebiopsis gigantea (strain 11061_1 CR5-6) TaxID=745531 RepID=A0A0C3S5T8_PHLG1|nr:hypothetical protein PHLGIDRAFT_31657 [Phlebiopsis gigantea 11061_1 CR5-6]
MLPAKRNKVDISSLTEEEQKLFRLYGKLPTHKNVLTKMAKDRKYFDSGDYALSKAGKAPQNTVGTTIPSPENIPHATSPPVIHTLSVSPSNSATSPIKESPLAEPEVAADGEQEAVSAAVSEEALVNPSEASEEAHTGDTVASAMATE